MSERLARRRGVMNVIGWACVLGACVVIAWAWGWGEWGLESGLGRRVYWAAFLARTFAWHLGCAAVVLGLTLVLARARRPGAVMVVMGVGVAALTSGWWPRARVEPGPGPAVTVMSMNLMVGRAEPELVMAEVGRFSPDVILVQEFTAEAEAWMDGALAEYPHRVLEPREHPFGMAVYSKLPISEVEVFGFGAEMEGVFGLAERAPQIRGVVRAEGREVVIQNVHTWPPVTASLLAAQVGQVRELAAWVKQEARPVILAGDFNATPMARSGRWLEEAGLLEAHAAAGRGRGATWPAYGKKAWLPGVRIDQVLVGAGAGGGARVEWAEVGRAVGSDHRPIAARIRLGPG